MNVNTAFPSKTLKASDLNGSNVSVTISHVEIEKMGSDNKPVVYFEGKQKGLVLNKTNAKRIVEITGSSETEDWKGYVIVLYPTETEFQGDTVECIRIKKPAQAARPTPPPKPPADDFQVSDDDVPF